MAFPHMQNNVEFYSQKPLNKHLKSETHDLNEMPIVQQLYKFLTYAENVDNVTHNIVEPISDHGWQEDNNFEDLSSSDLSSSEECADCKLNLPNPRYHRMRRHTQKDSEKKSFLGKECDIKHSSERQRAPWNNYTSKLNVGGNMIAADGGIASGIARLRYTNPNTCSKMINSCFLNEIEHSDNLNNSCKMCCSHNHTEACCKIKKNSAERMNTVMNHYDLACKTSDICKDCNKTKKECKCIKRRLKKVVGNIFRKLSL